MNLLHMKLFDNFLWNESSMQVFLSFSHSLFKELRKFYPLQKAWGFGDPLHKVKEIANFQVALCLSVYFLWDTHVAPIASKKPDDEVAPYVSSLS